MIEVAAITTPATKQKGHYEGRDLPQEFAGAIPAVAAAAAAAAAGLRSSSG
jgi:hypothetical protein